MTRFDIGKAEGVMAEQSAAEVKVRAAWEYAELYRDGLEVWVAFGSSDENTYGCDKNGVRHITSKFESSEAAWLYAYAITSAKQEEIRQLENQYVLLGSDNVRQWREMLLLYDWSLWRSESATWWVRRALVMARLEAALVELRCGMKQEEKA